MEGAWQPVGGPAAGQATVGPSAMPSFLALPAEAPQNGCFHIFVWIFWKLPEAGMNNPPCGSKNSLLAVSGLAPAPLPEEVNRSEPGAT